jgi:hypothetical protein
MMALAHSAPAVSLHAQGGPMVDSVRQFPRVEGSNLEEYNVVIIAFRREQQADVDSWLPFLREQKVVARGVRVYELPTLSRSYRWMRGFIDGGMARGIPEKATREVTITLYIDKTPFKNALAIPTEERIITLIVKRGGPVLWRADGKFSSGSGSDLAATLDSLGVHAAR